MANLLYFFNVLYLLHLIKMSFKKEIKGLDELVDEARRLGGRL
jgi:hypothetical protein